MNLGPPVNTNAPEIGPSYFVIREARYLRMLPKQKLMFGRPTSGNFDIWEVNMLDDLAFGSAERVADLSTDEFWESGPSVSPDGLEIFFHRSPPNGPFDIYFSTRREPDRPWSPPVSLGTPVNMPATSDAAPGSIRRRDGALLRFESPGRAWRLGYLDGHSERQPMIGRITDVCAAVVVASGLAEQAMAQAPALEVSGGYQGTRATDQALPAGWSADVAGRLNATWSVVGEASGSYRTGGRGSRRGRRTVRPLPLRRVCAGHAARVRRIVPFFSCWPAPHESARAQSSRYHRGDAATDFMVEPGGGVHVKVTEILGLVGQLDYRRVVVDAADDSDPGANQFRVLLGIVSACSSVADVAGRCTRLARLGL